MKNITENNILLAKFLGLKGEEQNVCKSIYGETPRRTILFSVRFGKYTAENLKFHSDWNWLMLVVDKIESLGMLFKVSRWREDEVLINGYWCTISDSFSGVEFADSAYIDDTETRIEAMYLACIEFVKWYNSQNK